MITLRATLGVVGRGGPPRGGGFPTDDDVRREVARLAANPVRLDRPVVILGGYHAPPQVAWWVREQVSRLTTGRLDDFLTVSFPFETTIGRAAERAVAAAARWQPGRSLDAIGLSMGGIVGRLAALTAPMRGHAAGLAGPLPDRLALARLYTFASPHQGSIRASVIAPDTAARDLKPDAPFLASLNRQSRDFELVCYAQEGDNLIAPEHAAPPGEGVTLGSASRMMSHFTTAHNPWFLVDLARRLRNEQPFLAAR